ncbi:ExbD/TolR family protein [Trinickia soli]|uniref:Biopolymer transporter ExbD n=1 Tax=Trinickia soli TaxID=380675 RepID=A0A2N7WCE2_9BURK|nr:biopolymer transporter ExbD [Trinickia soli]PMS27073.1 biopolymer transporter ExbD [Trinickia soli]CAB3712407.1 Biopolymer transport protein ExbD [Trinickia soli]
MAFSTQSDNDDVVSEINITPLVDVMLVLLVAFIVTAPLLNNAIRVNLPKTDAAASAPERPVTVSVDKDGGIFIDKRRIAREQSNAEFARLHAQHPEALVTLQGDEGTPYGNVAQVLAGLQRAGVTKLAVLTQPVQ